MFRTSPPDHGSLPSSQRFQRSKARSGVLLVLGVIAAVVLTACSSDAPRADGPVRLEIISLDHAPIRPITEMASTMAREYGEDVTLSAYHFDTPEGDSFADDNDITDHTPIAIFIDGETGFDIDGRTVKFLSFPQGEGTGVVADGDWTFDDLRAVLDRAVLDREQG